MATGQHWNLKLDPKRLTQPRSNTQKAREQGPFASREKGSSWLFLCGFPPFCGLFAVLRPSQRQTASEWSRADAIVNICGRASPWRRPSGPTGIDVEVEPMTESSGEGEVGRRRSRLRADAALMLRSR